jgi:hypothetical protein
MPPGHRGYPVPTVPPSSLTYRTIWRWHHRHLHRRDRQGVPLISKRSQTMKQFGGTRSLVAVILIVGVSGCGTGNVPEGTRTSMNPKQIADLEKDLRAKPSLGGGSSGLQGCRDGHG